MKPPKTLPFLIVPKASKSEKNKGLENMEAKMPENATYGRADFTDLRMDKPVERKPSQNHHPTVKPLKLMSYLIMLGSKEGDIVLDPFVGSGTTCIAAKQLKRNYIGIEKEEEYVKITEARLKAIPEPLL